MNNVFYVCNGSETTYDAFTRQVTRRAGAFSQYKDQVVALLAGHGPDFVINLFALWKACAVPFVVSTRVPWNTAADLMNTAQASTLVTDNPAYIHDAGSPSLSVIPAASEPDNGTDDYDSNALQLPTGDLILHTSGTTRSPKLVHFSRSSLLTSLSFEESAWNGHWTWRDATLGWLPLYHAFGLVSELLYAYRVRSRYYFSEANPRSLLAKLEQEPITRFSSVPWMLEKIVDAPTGLAALARLRSVTVGGAVTSPELGEKLVGAGVRLIQQYGMTELGATLRSSPDGDWQDLLPVIPSRHWTVEQGSGHLVVRPDCPIYGELDTRDTFERTPSGTLRYRNRLDDVLVHVNGEKTDALAIETMLGARAGEVINRCVVTGSGRRRPACLVLWKHDRPTAEDWNALRRAIDETNERLPRYSQLHHELVLPLPASDHVRIPLSPKGTVMRRAVEEAFSRDLDQLYRQAEV